MLIAGVVVLYQPDAACMTNILSYLPLLDHLFVVDNSIDKNTELLDGILALPGAEYIDMQGNQGIAAALREGVGRAADENYELCLTMDQDSRFPLLTRDALESRLSAVDWDAYGIVSMNFNGEPCEAALCDVTSWITSGNFIALKHYKKIHGFRSELFIDYVDFDLDRQFIESGKKIAYFADLSIYHQIGNPKSISFLGMHFTAMNHSPIRYYYRFRNARFLHAENPRYYRKMYFHDLWIDIPKMLLFDNDKRKKWRMIRLGRKHAKQGRLGVFHDDL